MEANDGVQAITELRREQTLDIGHFVACLAWVGKADGGFVHGFGARIGSHDDDHVAEIGFTAVVVGQCAVVHHLQQDVEDVWVGFFNFV